MSSDKLNLMGVPVDVDREEPARMEIETDSSRVLMSDVLQGNVPELEAEEGLQEMAANFIIAVIQYVIGDQVEPDVAAGTLRGIQSDGEKVELEVGVELDVGLTFLRNREQIRAGFELHPGEDEADVVSTFAVPMTVTGVMLSDIDYRRGMCTLLLRLKPPGDLVKGEVSDE